MGDVNELRELLYQAIRELNYVQDGATCGCTSALCATSNGAEIIQRGMALLGVKDLAEETLDQRSAGGTP